MISTLSQLEQRVNLSGITWGTYQRIKTELDNRNLRLTYHRGVLEIMAPSPELQKSDGSLGRAKLSVSKG